MKAHVVGGGHRASNCQDVRCGYCVQVTFSLTPLSGDPDLYVATHPNPTAHNFTWRASSMGSDVVQILDGDGNACTPPCRYYIAVFGYGGQATYTMRASSSHSRPTTLVAGLPQVFALG